MTRNELHADLIRLTLIRADAEGPLVGVVDDLIVTLEEEGLQ